MVDFHSPVKIRFLEKAEFEEILVREAAGKRIALFMNASLAGKLMLGPLVSKLHAGAAELLHVNRVHPNPSEEDILFSFGILGKHDVDMVVAVGGGSVIDTAKACIALDRFRKEGGQRQGQILDLISSREYVNHPNDIPFLAVPTTAGTGSEMTRWATIWDQQNRRKMSVEAEWLCPDSAWLVPELTLSLPEKLTISTGLDAFAQAGEAFWARSSTPIVKEIALASIRLIRDYLPRAVSEPGNQEFRSRMLVASTLSGMAFSNTRTTACHSISYPLTSLYGIPHGIAVILTFVEVLSLNLDAVPEIGEILDLFDGSAGIQGWLEGVTDGHYPLRLSAYGITEADLPRIAEESFTKGRMDNNPVDIRREDLEEILRKIL